MLETFGTKHKAQHRLSIKAVETKLKHTTVKQYKRERKPYKTDGALPLEGLGVSIIVLHVFQQYFTYIVAVSFIGGGNQSTWRKPLT